MPSNHSACFPYRNGTFQGVGTDTTTLVGGYCSDPCVIPAPCESIIPII